MMKAIVLDGFGGPEVMRYTEVETPSPAAGQVQRRRAVQGVGLAAGGLGGDQQLGIDKQAQLAGGVPEMGGHRTPGVGGQSWTQIAA